MKLILLPGPPDDGVLELLADGFMDLVAEVLQRIQINGTPSQEYNIYSL